MQTFLTRKLISEDCVSGSPGQLEDFSEGSTKWYQIKEIESYLSPCHLSLLSYLAFFLVSGVPEIPIPEPTPQSQSRNNYGLPTNTQGATDCNL